MSYAMGKNFNVVFLPLRYSAGDTYRGSGLVIPQSLRAVGVLFSPMVSGWAGGWREEVCPACISETVRCRKLILGRDIG